MRVRHLRCNSCPTLAENMPLMLWPRIPVVIRLGLLQSEDFNCGEGHGQVNYGLRVQQYDYAHQRDGDRSRL